MATWCCRYPRMMTRSSVLAGIVGGAALLITFTACTSSEGQPGRTTVQPTQCSTVTLEGAPRVTLAIAKSLVGKAVDVCKVGSGGSPVSFVVIPKERTEEPGWAELLSYPIPGIPSSTMPGASGLVGSCVDNTNFRVYVKADKWYQARNFECSGNA